MAEETITAQNPEIDPGMSVMPEEPGLMDVPTVIPELGLAAQALATQVSFAKKTWKDGSGGGTPVTAAELNRLEQGVADLTAAVNALRDSVSRYKTLWGKTLTIPVNKNQIGILICSASIGGIMVSGKTVYIDNSLSSLVSISVSGENATLTVDREMSLTALMMLN